MAYGEGSKRYYVDKVTSPVRAQSRSSVSSTHTLSPFPLLLFSNMRSETHSRPQEARLLWSIVLFLQEPAALCLAHLHINAISEDDILQAWLKILGDLLCSLVLQIRDSFLNKFLLLLNNLICHCLGNRIFLN